MQGLFRQLADKVVSHGNRIRELEGINRVRGEKLQDIERMFGDVKMGTEDLKSELMKSIDFAKEGTSAMEALGKMFEESQARINSLEANKAALEAEKAALATQILDPTEKATFKARYDILKDYKEGLLDEAQVDEEIEMFEEDFPEEVRRSSSAPEPVPTVAGPCDAEPPVQTNALDDRDEQS